MLRLRARLSAKQGRPRAAAIARTPEIQETTVTMDNASYGRSRPVADTPLTSSSISFGMTLLMAIACGMAAANIYYNQPMLGIMEAAFPGQATVIGLVPTATQLGFAAGLLLLVPLGDRFDRRRLILIQLAALTLSLAAAALAPGAWSLVVASALVGATSSVAQQIVPFAAELAEPSRRGATIGIVMSGLLCGILFGRALAGAVGDHYGWRAMFWLGLLLAVAVGLLLAGSYLEVGPRRRRATAPSSNLWASSGGKSRNCDGRPSSKAVCSARSAPSGLSWRCNSTPDTTSAPKSPACSASSARSACSLRPSPGRSQTGEVLMPSSDLAASSCSRPGWFLRCGA
jgi:hypothetical protein